MVWMLRAMVWMLRATVWMLRATVESTPRLYVHACVPSLKTYDSYVGWVHGQYTLVRRPCAL
eukprot:9360861-Pyramimonas_sp.AAC.1